MKVIGFVLLLLLIPEVQAQSAGIPAIAVDNGNGDSQT